MQNINLPAQPFPVIGSVASKVHDHPITSGFGLLGRHGDQTTITFLEGQRSQQSPRDLTGSHLFANQVRVVLFASMVMLCLACITELVFHRRVGGKELPFLVTVLDTWLVLRITHQKSSTRL